MCWVAGRSLTLEHEVAAISSVAGVLGGARASAYPSQLGESIALSPDFWLWCSGQFLAHLCHLLPSDGIFASCLPHVCGAEVFLVVLQGF